MGKKLPPLQIIEAPAWQQERLAAWLWEWRLDQRLRAVIAEESHAVSTKIAGEVPLGKGLARPFETPVAVGQIRLLSPHLLPPQAERPVYIAIFAEWEDDTLLFAPFSRFATPATPGEWLTGRDALPLRVLSLWNARTVPPAALAQSWLVAEFTEAECDAAWAVFEHVTTGEPLPEGLRELVGPPVRAPRDPRLHYQEEESALLAPLIEKDDTTGQTPKDSGKPAEKSKTGAAAHAPPVLEEVNVSAEEVAEVEALLNAIPFLEVLERLSARDGVIADSGAASALEALFFAPEQNVFLSVTPTGADVTFLVLDEREERSDALNGARILAADRAELATIRESVAVVPRGLLSGGFRLVLDNDIPVRLELRPG